MLSRCPTPTFMQINSPLLSTRLRILSFVKCGTKVFRSSRQVSVAFFNTLTFCICNQLSVL
ncbi:unnamed protein product [Hymenolepis diminuta]|uniref:Uncharacterized protein n=1 Tax=Hymenolepis diminuta TaxID=6216 RepID=A0A0R3SVS3_HYMDI|nr:unnamed protein product [Hymenolepis diminuta]